MFTDTFVDSKERSFYRGKLTDEPVKCYYDKYTSENIDTWKRNEFLERMIFKNIQAFYDEMKPKIGILHLKNGNVYKDFFSGATKTIYIY